MQMRYLPCGRLVSRVGEERRIMKNDLGMVDGFSCKSALESGEGERSDPYSRFGLRRDRFSFRQR